MSFVEFFYINDFKIQKKNNNISYTMIENKKEKEVVIGHTGEMPYQGDLGVEQSRCKGDPVGKVRGKEGRSVYNQDKNTNKKVKRIMIIQTKVGT